MIYRDVLGNPVSTASISIIGSDYGKPGKGQLCLKSISDAPKKRWDYISKDVSKIVSEMTNEGWICNVEKDGYNAPYISLVHIETQAEIDRIEKAEKEQFKNAKKGFVRFGDLPDCGYSKNYREDISEAGISVFEAEFIGKKFRIINLNSLLEATYFAVKHRTAYRIWGEIVGTGSDGEPVLKVSRKMSL